MDIRSMPCLGFDAAIVESRNGFGGGIYVFRFHMDLLLRLAANLRLILAACLEAGCARDMDYGHVRIRRYSRRLSMMVETFPGHWH